METLKLKIYKNSKNEQYTVTLPKKKLDFKDKVPQFLKIKIGDIIYG